MKKSLKQLSRLITGSSPDGIQAISYHKSWKIMGKSVCKMVQLSLTYSYMLKELNRIYITLFPRLISRIA